MQRAGRQQNENDPPSPQSQADPSKAPMQAELGRGSAEIASLRAECRADLGPVQRPGTAAAARPAADRPALVAFLGLAAVAAAGLCTAARTNANKKQNGEEDSMGIY